MNFKVICPQGAYQFDELTLGPTHLETVDHQEEGFQRTD
jgi:hypothetical protein